MNSYHFVLPILFVRLASRNINYRLHNTEQQQSRSLTQNLWHLAFTSCLSLGTVKVSAGEKMLYIFKVGGRNSKEGKST